MSSDSLVAPTVSTGFDVNAHFRAVMSDLGLSPEDTGGTITFVGEDPIFPSVHRLGACIGIPIMAGAAGIADIWRQHSGSGQDLSLDLRKAIHGINPLYKFMPTINGQPYQLPFFIGNPMGFDLYQTKDGRFFLPTGAYPRLLDGMCTFLGCSPDKNSIAKAVSKWDAMELDEAAADKELVFAVVRTPEEWAAHPQGKQLAEKPLVEIVKIGDSDPQPFTPAARPLSGLYHELLKPRPPLGEWERVLMLSKQHRPSEHRRLGSRRCHIDGVQAASWRGTACDAYCWSARFKSRYETTKFGPCPTWRQVRAGSNPFSPTKVGSLTWLYAFCRER